MLITYFVISINLVNFVKSLLMKERIRQIINLENLTHSEFARVLGVQRSNISHILAGRNKPSIDFIHKLLTNFTNIDADWLIMGKGSMYKNPPNSIFDEEHKNKKTNNKQNSQNETENDDKNNISDNSSPFENSSKKIHAGIANQILVLYDDETFSTYKKRD